LTYTEKHRFYPLSLWFRNMRADFNS
jgi:hypothetical protein